MAEVTAERDAARRQLADLRVALGQAHARILDVERILLDRHAAELHEAREARALALAHRDEALLAASAAVEEAHAAVAAADARAQAAADSERALAVLQATKLVRWSRLPRRLYGALAAGRRGRRA